MPDEEIDKLLRDAASQHHPPYDDTAWGKMETLLDKHLPEKKDRKKPVFFLLFFLLLGGAIFWGIESAQKNSSSTIAERTANKNAATTVSDLPATNNNVATVNSATSQNNVTTVPSPLPSVANNLNIVTPNKSTNYQQYVNNSNNIFNTTGHTKTKIKNGIASGDEDNTPAQKNTITKSDDGNNFPSSANDKNNIVVTDNNDKIVSTDKDVIVKKIDSVDFVKTDEKTPTATSSSKQKKNNKTVADKFAITVSGGADLSYVTLNNAGKVKPVYGAGIKYNIGKHFAISSGLNVAKKVYTALPTQYKFVGYTNPNLVKINADCNVYEVPLTVYYNFKQVKNHGWFAGVGLSSFLMKKESYDYYYENANGQSYNYDKTITNENKHFLSVLSLSAGYQHKLSNRVSFIAEPYLKVPLSGIGLGKIKLNSTGVMLTAAIKPFSKKKK